jgi:hypothetical protein
VSQHPNRAIPAILDFGKVLDNGRVSTRGDKMTGLHERNAVCATGKTIVDRRHGAALQNF